MKRRDGWRDGGLESPREGGKEREERNKEGQRVKQITLRHVLVLSPGVPRSCHYATQCNPTPLRFFLVIYLLNLY